MPVRGIICLAVVILTAAVLERDRIYNWIEKEFGADESAEKEKENEQ